MNHGPNFFIIGAPKCGTTALSEYLRGHPAVFMSTPKELFFFCDDFIKHKTFLSLEEYLAAFSEAKEEHQAIGEASALYLHSDCAIDNIRAFNPAARLIVMLRNPVDMVHSFHGQMVFAGEETEHNFEAAWQLMAARRRGQNLPRIYRDQRLFDYDYMGRFDHRIDFLLKKIPREQILFIKFDDFTAHTEKSFQAVLAFLGLPGWSLPCYEKINARKENRYRALTYLLNLRKVAEIKNVYKVASNMPLFGPIVRQSNRAIRRFNTHPAKPQSLTPSFRNELLLHFEDTVMALGAQTGMDISNWLPPSSKLAKQ